MKYIHAMTMMLCLVGIFLLVVLGSSYMDPNNGYGLHPMVAMVLGVVLAFVGSWSADRIGDCL